jgi:hypothetical protein
VPFWPIGAVVKAILTPVLSQQVAFIYLIIKLFNIGQFAITSLQFKGLFLCSKLYYNKPTHVKRRKVFKTCQGKNLPNQVSKTKADYGGDETYDTTL